MKNTVTRSMVVAAAIFTLGFVDVSIAQDDEVSDISAVTCRDILLSSGEDRDAIILVLHAYRLGEMKQPKYDPDVLANATDDFIDACIAEPDSKALKTLKAQFKNGT